MFTNKKILIVNMKMKVMMKVTTIHCFQILVWKILIICLLSICHLHHYQLIHHPCHLHPGYRYHLDVEIETINLIIYNN